MNNSYENQALPYVPKTEEPNVCSLYSVDPTMELRQKDGKFQQKVKVQYKYKFDVRMDGMWAKFGEVSVWMDIPEVTDEE